MPLFTLKRLIAECARKTWKTRRMPKGIPEPERVRIYEEIWMALNLWLRAALEQGRGGHIPNFGKFCWDVKANSLDPAINASRRAADSGRSVSALDANDIAGSNRNAATGARKYVPKFFLDDVMSREYRAKPWKKPLHQGRLSKASELNFTELAIRWSTLLTKDLVFTGLRDMLARLRQAIKHGQKCKVRFGCGKLLVKECRVAFVFDPSLRVRRGKSILEAQTLPPSMTIAADSEIGDLLAERSDAGSLASSRRSLPPTPLSARLRASASAPQLMPSGAAAAAAAAPSPVPALDFAGAGLTAAATPEEEENNGAATDGDGDGDGVPFSGSRLPAVSEEGSIDEVADLTAFNADRSCVFAVSEKYRGGARPDRLDRTAMRDALKLAYERHLVDVEAEIAGEEAQADHWRYQLWERELAYRADHERRRQELASLDEFLRTQIVEQKQRLKESDLDVRGVKQKGKAYPDFRRLKRLAKRYGVRRGPDGKIQIGTSRSERGGLSTGRSTARSSGGGRTERLQREEAVALGRALRDQIETRMDAAKHRRRSQLEEGRRFVDQINWDSQRMLSMMASEKEAVARELKEAWDRDTHVRNVLKLRRKMLKRGGFVFRSKPPTPATGGAGPGGSAAPQQRFTEKGLQQRAKGLPPRAPAPGDEDKINLTATTTLPAVPKDHSVGYDMRTAR